MARAERFRSPTDARRFVAGRGILRAILGRYLGRDPSTLSFRYDASGKPSLAPDGGETRCRFNVSHSNALALYAIAWEREVGVDVEYVRPGSNEGIAERFFAPREVASLGQFPADRRDRAFFACWTRKEAYLKARGQGLLLGLDRFEVSVDPDETVVSLRSDAERAEASRWSLRALAPAPGHAAAVAAEGHDWALMCLQWIPS